MVEEHLMKELEILLNNHYTYVEANKQQIHWLMVHLYYNYELIEYYERKKTYVQLLKEKSYVEYNRFYEDVVEHPLNKILKKIIKNKNQFYDE